MLLIGKHHLFLWAMASMAMLNNQRVSLAFPLESGFSGFFWGLHPPDDSNCFHVTLATPSGACEKVVDPGKYPAAGLQNSRLMKNGRNYLHFWPTFPWKIWENENLLWKIWENRGFSWTFRFIPEISCLVKIVEIDLRRPSKCSACPWTVWCSMGTSSETARAPRGFDMGNEASKHLKGSLWAAFSDRIIQHFSSIFRFCSW